MIEPSSILPPAPDRILDVREAAFPPPEVFVQEVNRRLSACLLMVRFLPADTRQQIAEEIADTERIVEAIKANLRVLSSS
jgi:hypothetical protein